MFSAGGFVESVLGRFTIVVLFTTVVALVLFMLFLLNRVVPPVWLKYAVVTATGLGAGFSTRRLLAGRNSVIKTLSIAGALVIALGLLNFFSRGFVGFDLFRVYPSLPWWDGWLSLALASGVAWLALRGWSRAPRPVHVEPRLAAPPPAALVPEPHPPARVRTSTSQPRTRVRAGAGQPRPTVHAGAGRPRARVRAGTSSFATTWASFRAQLSAMFPPARRTSPPARRRKLDARPAPKPRRRHAVQLSAREEHVCPYCLDKVVKNDPRGVKICKVCKTWHHADCWAITGVCQVPHQYVN